MLMIILLISSFQTFQSTSLKFHDGGRSVNDAGPSLIFIWMWGDGRCLIDVGPSLFQML